MTFEGALIRPAQVLDYAKIREFLAVEANRYVRGVEEFIYTRQLDVRS